MSGTIDVFLCYRHAMAIIAKQFKRYLEKNGFVGSVWYSDDELVGNYLNDIPRLINEAECAILFIDSDFTKGFKENNSDYHHKECITAHEILEIIKKKNLNPDFTIITVFLDRDKGFNEDEYLTIQKLLEENGVDDPQKKADLLTHNNHWSFYTAKEEETELFEKIKNNICLKNKATKYAVLAKDSLFSQTIVESIKDAFVYQPDFSLESVFFEKLSQSILGNHDMAVWMATNIEQFDGFIIRPFVKITNDLFEAIKKCTNSNKRVILFDIDMSTEQLKEFDSEKVPLFVCSDQEKGGALIAKEINKIVCVMGKSNTTVLFCDASKGTAAIKERTDSIKRHLQKYELFDIVNNTIELANLNPTNSAKKIKDHFIKEKCWYYDDSIKNIIIYVGNDNVALSFAKILQSDKDIIKIIQNKKIILIGYDGVKQNHSNNSILDSTGFDYITVDVQPYDQGKAIADLCLNQSQSESRIIKKEPSLESHIKMLCRTTNRFEEIEQVAFLKKAIIFDFDGTLADTEELHWKAYNELLEKEYNIHLTDENILRYIGNSEKEIYKMIESDFSVDISEEYFLESRLGIYLDLVESEKLEPYEWVEPFLLHLAEKGIACYILSSQVPEIVDILLEKWDIKKYFPDENIICTHDGKIQKSEIFEDTKQFIAGINSAEICVVEDSDKVMELAERKGIDCIGIIHRFNKDKLNHCVLAYDKKRANGLFIGLCGLDIVFKGDRLPEENGKIKAQEFYTQIGGPAAKAAITCAKLGGKATLITSLGNSSIARHIKKELSDQGIKVVENGNDVFNEPNISAVFVNSGKGSRTIISGQNKITTFSASKEISEEYDYCLYDCNFPNLTEEISSIVDYNKIPLVLDCGSWKDNIECALSISKVAISSSKFQSESDEDIFSLGKKFGIPYVAKTNEGEAIDYSDNHETGNIEVIKIEQGNTLGAGDVLHGAFCYYYYVEERSFSEALEVASHVATNYVKTGIIQGEKI